MAPVMPSPVTCRCARSIAPKSERRNAPATPARTSAVPPWWPGASRGVRGPLRPPAAAWGRGRGQHRPDPPLGPIKWDYRPPPAAAGAARPGGPLPADRPGPARQPRTTPDRRVAPPAPRRPCDTHATGSPAPCLLGGTSDGSAVEPAASRDLRQWREPGRRSGQADVARRDRRRAVGTDAPLPCPAWAASAAAGLRPCVEWFVGFPHGVQHDTDLARQSNGGSLEAEARHKGQSPHLHCRRAPHPYQERSRRLEQIASQQLVAAFRDACAAINLT